MSEDMVALLRDQPDLDDALPDAEGGRIRDGTGRLLVTIATPVLVSTPGEVERLLGVRPPLPPPLWWVDIRAAADLTEAARIARRCADLLAERYGGAVWTPGSSGR